MSQIESHSRIVPEEFLSAHTFPVTFTVSDPAISKKADPYMGVFSGPLDFNLYELNFIVENLKTKHGSCVKSQTAVLRTKETRFLSETVQ